jgi:predicted O-linked N-acetylglucosamine transferase (SPINDLY family)
MSEAIPPEAYAAAECFYTGNYARALELAEAANRRTPCPEAFGIIAGVWEAYGAHRRAALAYRRGMALFPDNPILTVNFARQLRAMPVASHEAAHMLTQLLQRDPGCAAGHLSLIETLRGFVSDLDQALSHIQQYLALYPNDGEGHLAHALTLWNRGELQKALRAADRALDLGARAERVLELQANIHIALGSATDALACYRALLCAAPHAETHSRLLMTMQYCDCVSEDEIFAETQSWVRSHIGHVEPSRVWPRVGFEADRPLRFAVLSRDFRLCSTLFLARPLIENLPAEWTIVFYSNVECPDPWTDFFRSCCEAWVDITAMDDDAVATRIMSDEIDVLLDLNGHTLGGRLGVFARKPAPVQLTWLDYVNTTGLTTFDAIIADAGHLPHSEQSRYAEPIVHLADDLYRYAPPWNAPPVADLPVARRGFVTFGCFNAAYKLSPSALSLWSEVLHAVPSSRLLLNAPEYRYADTRARICAVFAEHEIGPERLEFRLGAAEPIAMLAAYGEVDIALDPMPYSGGLTTIEGLYMGVPAITPPGTRFGSRHSSVHLRAIGLTDWIGADMSNWPGITPRIRRNLQPYDLGCVRAWSSRLWSTVPALPGNFAKSFATFGEGPANARQIRRGRENGYDGRRPIQQNQGARTSGR